MQIARQYRCCRDTVYQGIVRAGIPVKRRRRPAECRVCGEAVCLIKVYRPNRRGYVWVPTYWCAFHYMAERRRWERDFSLLAARQSAHTVKDRHPAYILEFVVILIVWRTQRRLSTRC